MRSRVLASLGAASTIALVATASLPVSGQSGTPALVITAYNGGTLSPYTVPKTPWGDPDLQGVWSSDDATMPMSRPQNFGDRLYQNDEEFAARQKQIQSGISNAENAVGSFRGDFARRAFRQTSLIVDPPDGRTPAFTAEAQKRRAPRDQGTFGDGPFNSTEDFTLYDRCITRGIVGSVMRVVYGNGNRIVQAPGMVAISYEMIHDTRFFYTDGRPHTSPGIKQYLGDSRAHWEGRGARRRNDEPDGQDQHRSEWQRPTPQRQDEDHRAVQTRGGSDPPVPNHRGRPCNLRETVHAVIAADAARWRNAVALRMPRRQLCDPAVSRCGTRRRPEGRSRPPTRRHPSSSSRAGRPRRRWTTNRRGWPGRNHPRSRSWRGARQLEH